jgi:integrase
MARRKRLPGRLLHKASGQSIVVLNGKTHYLGKHDSQEAKDEYDRIIAEWLANGRDGLNVEHASKEESEVSVVVAKYILWAKDYYRTPEGKCSGQLPGIKQALKPLRKLYGRTPVNEFGPKALRTVQHNLLDRKNPRTGKPLSRKYINGLVGHIRRMFKWAVAEELVASEVLHGLQAVRDLRAGRVGIERERPPVDAVEWERVEATLPHLGKQIGAMVLLQWWTGMRPGEVCRMRTQDIDRTGEVWLYRPATHKNQHRGKERIVPMGPEAQAIVKPFLRVDQGYLFQPAEADEEFRKTKREDRKTPLWPSHLQAQEEKKAESEGPEFGEFYKTQAYARAIRRAGKRAKVKHWSPNMLRHAAATRLRHEIGIEAARVVLGHTSASTTEIYAEADRLKAIDAMRKLG